MQSAHLLQILVRGSTAVNYIFTGAQKQVACDHSEQEASMRFDSLASRQLERRVCPRNNVAAPQTAAPESTKGQQSSCSRLCLPCNSNLCANGCGFLLLIAHPTVNGS